MRCRSSLDCRCRSRRSRHWRLCWTRPVGRIHGLRIPRCQHRRSILRSSPRSKSFAFRPFEQLNLLLHLFKASLILVNLLYNMVPVLRIQPIDQDGYLLDIVMYILQCRQWWTSKLPLPRCRRQSSISLIRLLSISPQLLPQKPQKQLLQRIGGQSFGIIRVGLLDERVVLEQVRDLREGPFVDSVGEKRLE